MAQAKGAKRTTPASRRLQTAKRRSQKQAKRRQAEKKPSWQEALKRRYVTAARHEARLEGADAPAADEGKAQGRRKGALAPWKHGRNARKRERDAEAEAAAGFGDEEDEFGPAGEGMEVQDDIDEDREKRLNEAQPLAAQLFLKGLPTDADADQLQRQFSSFGEVKRVLIVRNNMTRMPTGSAFVHFAASAATDAMYAHAQQNARDLQADHRSEQQATTEGLSKHKAKQLLHKLKQDAVVSKDPFVFVGTTRATVHRPMARTENADFIASMHKGKKDKKKRTPTGNDDPRNLYLLQEGLIEEGTPAASGLTPRVLGVLRRDYETRKQQLRNVNFFVSKTRLSVRNLPRTYTDGDLRKLFLESVRGYLKEHPEYKEKARWSKHGPVRQCRVLTDSTGRGKGYGFVEFLNHNVALRALRALNNNPEVFGRHQRPVVHFAVENSNAIEKMARKRELRRAREEQQKLGGFYDDK